MLFMITNVYAQSNTNLPLPRMVSVKSKEVRVRAGAGQNFPTKWVLMRKDMPVEIIAEFESWRKIRDWEGAEGWIFHSYLSSARAGLITQSGSVLRRLSSDDSPAIAKLNPGITAKIRRCDEVWCFVTIKNYNGWIKRSDFWGLYPNEKIE